MVELVGAEQPRLWTPPLRELTPETSLGFRCIAFAAQILGIELDPWQRWTLIHMLELREDGSWRYRTFLLLVARQNGKTTIGLVLALWLLWTGRIRLAVGTAQDREIARRTWSEGVALALDCPDLAGDLDGRPRRANGQESLAFVRNGQRPRGTEWIIKATTEDAGRGVPGVGLLLADELRTHRDYRAWAALSKTTMAVPNSLTLGLSNAGDDLSVVLNDLREAALAGRDQSLGIAEFSAPDGCALDDEAAIAQANPCLGRGRITVAAIASARALDPVAVYRTEILCQRVAALETAVDLAAWAACMDPSPVRLGPGPDEDLDDWLARIAGQRRSVCFDVSLDGQHAALLVAAPAEDARVRVEVVRAWHDLAVTRAELPDLLERVAADALGWYPDGPAAEFGSILRAAPGSTELRGSEVNELCAEFDGLVRARGLLHPGDPLLDAHLTGSRRLYRGDGWRFARRGAGHINAAYAAAGAVHLALAPVEEEQESAYESRGFVELGGDGQDDGEETG